MIKVLEGYDPRAAAGIMAEAALTIGYEALPPSVSIRDADVLRRVVSEVRKKLGVSPHDFESETLSRIASFLDEESDRVLSPPDTKSALDRMAARGDLPSDLYKIHIIRDVQDIYEGNFALERDIIHKTIADADREQHYGQSLADNEPAMISLFMRPFRTRWPAKNFHMLVAGQRGAGFDLFVHQAWRVYPTHVDTRGLSTPIEFLRAFAGVYGAPVTVDGKTGSFFLFANSAPKLTHIKTTKHVTVTSRFAQAGDRSALVVGIDATKYKSILKVMRVGRDDMTDFYGEAAAHRQ